MPETRSPLRADARPSRAFGRRTLLSACAGLAAALLCAVGPASAQTYPTRPVTLVVPYAPGGASDALGRLVAKWLQEKLGQPFVVENRPGAGSAVGADFVARATPDGYTLLLATSTTLAINPALYKKLPYDPLTSFTPVGLVANVPFVLVANPSTGVKTLKDFVALAKAKPGTLTYGSAGNGSPQHLFMELLKTSTGIDVIHVPYKGSAPAMNDLVGGQISLMVSDLAPALGQIQAGKITPLGVTTAQRLPGLPDVPTLAEAGVAGYEATAWQGIVGPAGLPPDIVSALSAQLRAFVADPATAEAFARIGLQPISDTPSEFAAYIRTEIGKWGPVVRATGATAD
ncbi:tripartite tricarboxylate transporter substrate binding protein [Aquabacter sp. L1I39]|uniref:Bug family tripartite tricarboxylate transporter substrate binding protein n=1 Tax=Aquabacter sp. L1I39 TaxID=2820278 RepID=UPI001ADC6ED0|nr:tripartite tricarboxylate transporter substrate binding protein [Aquabacter sp. L1I39]QTL02145.1 tripartite tricarboxylate transporter substrate binding protein [Aquabacter sp. L1I39]